jgi:hypothetical protein
MGCRSRAIRIVTETEQYGTMGFDFLFQVIQTSDADPETRFGRKIANSWIVDAIRERAEFFVYCESCLEERGIKVIFEDGTTMEVLDALQGRLIVAEYLGDEFPPDTPFWRIEELLANS